jgi:hypothetical protein
MRVYEKFSPNGHGPVDVIAELERLLGRMVAFSDFATARIEALTAEQWAAFSPRTAAEVDLFRAALRDAGRLLAETAKLGLIERAIAARHDAEEAHILAHRRVAERVADVIDGVLSDLGSVAIHGMIRPWRELLPVGLRSCSWPPMTDRRVSPGRRRPVVELEVAGGRAGRRKCRKP